MIIITTITTKIITILTLTIITILIIKIIIITIIIIISPPLDYYPPPGLLPSPWTTILQWWGGLCTSMNPRAMLVGANAPGRVTQARQVEG